MLFRSGYSQHAGMVIVCDGTAEAAKRIERVLWNDPASGVMRHADAGYDAAIACAREQGLNLPMLRPDVRPSTADGRSPAEGPGASARQAPGPVRAFPRQSAP